MSNFIYQQANKHFFARIFEDIVGYFRIYEHIKLVFRGGFGSDFLDFRSEEEFWYSILGDKYCGPTPDRFLRIATGTPVRFRDFFLCEWAPKLAGQIWTYEGASNLKEGFKHYEDRRLDINGQKVAVLDPYGKRKVVQAGFGSIRINPSNNTTNFYMYMSLVSHKHWHCDYGIPIVVTERVYNEFLRYSNQGAPAIRELKGILIFQRDMPFKSFLPRALGSTLTPETEELLRYRPSLPKCFVYVDSPMSISFLHNDSHPECTAWTMYEQDGIDDFNFTYTNFNPISSNSVRESVEFINAYVTQHNGTRIITDFDGIEPKLESEISIDQNPMSEQKTEVRKILKKIESWSSRMISNLNY